jgi:ABC-type polysaccharide/polyol phosphate export permease
MIVMTIVFSQIFNRGIAYPAYVLTGLTCWNFFSQSTRSSLVSMLGGSMLFDRIYLPRTSFVVSTIGTGIINLLFSMVPLIIIMLVTGQPMHWTFLLFPIPVILLAVFSLGVALIISTYVVFFPDITEIYPILLTAWMYLSPVMIPFDLLEKIGGGWLMRLNPMSYFIQLFRDMVVYGQFPAFDQFATAILLAFGSLALGWYMFTKRSDRFTYDA